MANRVLFTIIVLLGASAAASAHANSRAPSALVLQDRGESSSNHGAKIDSATGAGLAVPPRTKTLPTFVQFHSARVENNLMLFQPTQVGITPGRTRNAGLLARPPVKNEVRFFAPTEAADDLEVRRAHDRLLLFRGPQPQSAALALGLAMFGATTILSAHAPRPFRIVFDGPVHLGPAIFDGGGMGAGIGGRFLRPTWLR